VTEEARTKCGLDVDGFTGRIREYDPAARTRYTNADRVAVTTYNSLFNTNPYFSNAHVVIVDDAHAAENYIAQLWTFRVERFKDEHKALFTALCRILKPILEPYLYARLTGDWQSLTDKLWVDKIPTPDLLKIANDVREVIDAYVEDLDLSYPARGCRLFDRKLSRALERLESARGSRSDSLASTAQVAPKQAFTVAEANSSVETRHSRFARSMMP
jgi:hypothetical protein